MTLSIDQSGFGVPVAVTATEGQTTGVSWGEDGMIYFTAISRLAPLRVPASGGTIEEITVADTRRSAGRYAAPQSPDGDHFAYVPDEEGSTEVYVRPYPDAGSRVRISTDGGTEPVWRRDGRELFYRSHDRMMSVSTQTAPSFRAGEPETLFEQPFQLDQWGKANYDVSLDGERFLMVRTTPSTTTCLPVIVNWFDELKRLVPTDQ